MSDINMDELFYGKEASEKFNAFQEELRAIEQKHIDFFKAKKSHLQSQKHDSLFNHCISQMGGGTVRFQFVDNEVPDYIIDECHEAFKKIFDGANYIPPR